MIESILSISKRNQQNNSIASVSIEILPEFGWANGANRLFGPGTLFQGYVVVKCNQYSARATRLRVYFKGIETMLTYDVGPGVIRTHTKSLFKISTILWQKKDENDLLCTSIKYKFLFTVQMPMIQYPPSMDHNLYRCCYKLSAYLDPSLGYGEIPVMAQTHINYIPLIEIRLLKAPVFLEDVKKKKKKIAEPAFSVKLYSIEYLSGDTLKLAICTTRSIANLAAQLNLYRVITFKDKSMPVTTELVQTQTEIMTIQSKQESWIFFKINDGLVPTVTYSSIITLTYKLKIKIHVGDDKKNKWKVINMIQNNTTASVFETPIVIGTMGLGVRVVDELGLYSRYGHIAPKFMKNLEHGELLPQYESVRLPDYSSAEEHKVENVNIGRVTPASSVTIIRSSL